MAAFTEVDVEFFCGRQAEVAKIWHKLRDKPRLLALLGPSGSGKSSLAQAGLIPLLKTRHGPGQAAVTIVRPTDTRFQEVLSQAGAATGEAPWRVLVLDQFKKSFWKP